MGYPKKSRNLGNNFRRRNPTDWCARWYRSCWFTDEDYGNEIQSIAKIWKGDWVVVLYDSVYGILEL